MNFSFDAMSYPYASRRSVVYGRRGMVATANPLAAQAGLEILKQDAGGPPVPGLQGNARAGHAAGHRARHPRRLGRPFQVLRPPAPFSGGGARRPVRRGGLRASTRCWQRLAQKPCQVQQGH